MNELVKNENAIVAVNIETGLTTPEIEERIALGKVNNAVDVPTKSVGRILWTNFFTLFNILNVTLGILVIAVGSYKNALFLGIVFVNAFIGLFQELRAKKTIDNLSLISAPKAKVIRNGEQLQIPINEMVLDDIVIYENGNQICSDAIVVSGEMEVNESLLTGESDAVLKCVGDKIFSGSYVISGYAKTQNICVGRDNYASKISQGAKYIKKTNSQILKSVRSIIKIMSFIIIPLGIYLFYRQFKLIADIDTETAIVKTVASIVSMIPEGLVLLTTTVFALSVVKLGKYNTLVQDIYCIETLARVDVLCLDKTGTITEGSMEVDDFISFDKDALNMNKILSAMVHSLNDNNPTSSALKEKFCNNPYWAYKYVVPFSSKRKWSGVSFTKFGSYALGAGEFMLGERYSEISELAESHSEQGKRVLTLVHTEGDIKSSLPEDVKIVGLVLLTDKIRVEAYDTFQFFEREGVTLKVISGDNPITVSKIAEKAGMTDFDKYVDASTLKTTDDIFNALLNYKIFGRVTPEQKLEIVKQLKKQGHTVGMTGDGVNDVLALKEADCSIAMASGSDAARNVSSLVLLDNNFSSMPRVVAEGRQSINNLQRSSSLFLIKTIYATFIAFIIAFSNWSYPFVPIQLTLISSLAVGTPSLILALEPNTDKIKGNFIQNSIKRALPSAMCIVLTLFILLIISNIKSVALPFNDQSTLATLLLGSIMFFVLFRICFPFSKMRLTLFVSCLAAFVFVCFVFSDFFSLTSFTSDMYKIGLPLLFLTYPFMIICEIIATVLIDKYNIKILDKFLNLTEKITESKLQLPLLIKKNKDKL